MRDATFTKKRVHYQHPTTPSSDKTSSTIKSAHLPRIRHNQLGSVSRQHSINEFASKRAVQILLKFNKSPSKPTKRYITKTMSTTTTGKKSAPLGVNGILSQSTRSHSSDSNRRVGYHQFNFSDTFFLFCFRLVNFGGRLNEMKSKFVRIMKMLIKIFHQKSIH